MVYLNHRSFLPPVDALLKSNEGFPQEPVGKFPSPKNMSFIDTANGKYSAAVTNVEKKLIAKKTGCKGPYSLRRLPYHDRYLNTPVEPMHLLKNVAEHIVKLISGLADSVKVRKEEKDQNRFRDSWLNPKKECELPPAPFRMNRNELAIASKRVLSVKVPHGLDWNHCQPFTKNSIGQMKSSEWRVLISSGILKYCIRGLLGELQRKTLFELCDVLALLTSDVISVSNMDSIEYRLHRVLSLMERDFPVSLHVITFHLLHHLPMFVGRFGPVRGFWMYPMERFNSWITRRILNRRYPEATILQTYRIFELTFFLQLSKQLPYSEQNETDLTTMLLDCTEQDESNPKTSNLDRDDLRNLETYYRKISKVSGEICLSSSIEVLPKYTLKTKDGFSTRYSAANTAGWHFDSSLVSLKLSSSLSNGEVLFGQIQSIFKHSINPLDDTVLAHVSWYNSFRDNESGLYYIDTQLPADFYPIISILDLSHPFIFSEEGNNVIWILNFANTNK